MPYDILAVRYVVHHTLWLRFRDGSEGEVDLAPHLTGPSLAPLLDLERFRQVTLHPVFHTLVWPDGADLAPEFLYERLHANARA